MQPQRLLFLFLQIAAILPFQLARAGPLAANIDRSLAFDFPDVHSNHIFSRALNTSNCRVLIQTDIWTTCPALITSWNISLSNFVALNPSVNSDCSLFVPGSIYCLDGLALLTPWPISTTGLCGSQSPTNVTCVGSSFGNCCSTAGRCGSGSAFCVDPNCQAGRCVPATTSTTSTTSTVTSSSTSSSTSLPPFSPSPDGTCGFVKKYKCTGTKYYYGDCCSAAGYCGLDVYSCSNLLGCQSAYGLCDTTVIVTTILNSTLLSKTSTISSSTSRTSTSTKPSSTITSSSASPTSTVPVYVSGNANFNLLGCYAEPATTRALPNQYGNDTMTIEMCLSYASNYNYAGVEYGRECWYGNTLDPGATKAATNTPCSFLCPGNSLEYCGAGNYLILYGLKGSVSVPTTTTSTIASTTTSSAPASTTTGVVASYGGYTYYGCASEATGVRLLPNLYASDSMTVELCLQTASAAGATYAGIEYGRECWYGSVFGATPVVLNPAAVCNMVCPGNTLEYCGAGNLLTLYQIT